MEKPLEKQVSTPETTVHLWSVPRKHQNKPSKVDVVQQILKEYSALKGIELLPLSLADLQALHAALAIEIKSSIPNSRSKAEYIKFLQPLGLQHPEKLPVASLRAISEYVSRQV